MGGGGEAHLQDERIESSLYNFRFKHYKLCLFLSSEHTRRQQLNSRNEILYMFVELLQEVSTKTSLEDMETRCKRSHNMDSNFMSTRGQARIESYLLFCVIIISHHEKREGISQENTRLD